MFPPSPVTRLLYASLANCPQMNPGVKTIVLVLSRFFANPDLRNIANIYASDYCNYSVYLPVILLLLA